MNKKFSIIKFLSGRLLTIKGVIKKIQYKILKLIFTYILTSSVIKIIKQFLDEFEPQWPNISLLLRFILIFHEKFKIIKVEIREGQVQEDFATNTPAPYAPKESSIDKWYTSEDSAKKVNGSTTNTGRGFGNNVASENANTNRWRLPLPTRRILPQPGLEGTAENADRREYNLGNILPPLNLNQDPLPVSRIEITGNSRQNPIENLGNSSQNLEQQDPTTSNNRGVNTRKRPLEGSTNPVSSDSSSAAINSRVPNNTIVSPVVSSISEVPESSRSASKRPYREIAAKPLSAASDTSGVYSGFPLPLTSRTQTIRARMRARAIASLEESQLETPPRENETPDETQPRDNSNDAENTRKKKGKGKESN